MAILEPHLLIFIDTVFFQSRSNHFRLVQLFPHEFAIMTHAPIDRENIDRHELTVTCADHGRPALTSHLDMVVMVDDLNDNAPKFLPEKYDVQVKESIATMEVISKY